MKRITIEIENLKCHGCANTVRREIGRLEGLYNVEVDVDGSTVDVTYDEKVLEKDDIVKRLTRIGYPEKGSNNLRSEMTSYVSCAIGRVRK